MVGLVSAVRMVFRVLDAIPVGTLRRERKPPSYLAYLSAVGVVAGPAAMFCRRRRRTSPYQRPGSLTAGMLLSVVGLEGLSRIAVAAAGRLLADWTRAQVAGSRMYHGEERKPCWASPPQRWPSCSSCFPCTRISTIAPANDRRISTCWLDFRSRHPNWTCAHPNQSCAPWKILTV